MIQIDPVRLERDENDLLALDPKLPLRLSENREIRDFAQRNLALHLDRLLIAFFKQYAKTTKGLRYADAGLFSLV